MNFLKRWLILGVIVFIVGVIFANVFFDLTWLNSKDEIPESAFCAALVFGFLGAITSNDR